MSKQSHLNQHNLVLFDPWIRPYQVQPLLARVDLGAVEFYHIRSLLVTVSQHPVVLHAEVSSSALWGRKNLIATRLFHYVHMVESIPWAAIACQPRSGYVSMNKSWPIQCGHGYVWVIACLIFCLPTGC